MISATKGSDLTPLEGMPLERLETSTLVSDLSPLRGMPLRVLIVAWSGKPQLSDLTPLNDCTGLQELVVTNAKVSAAQVAALQAKLPNCKIEWDGAGKGPVANGFGATLSRAARG